MTARDSFTVPAAAPESEALHAIEYMTRGELTALFRELGIIWKSWEPTRVLRQYVREEHRAGRMPSAAILAHFEGVL